MQVLNRLRASVLTLVLLALTTALARADAPVTLYVGKTEVQGVVRNGRVLVPGDALLHAMGYAWSDSANGLVLTSGKAGGPRFPVGRVVMHLDGKTAVSPSVEIKGRVYIDARAAGEGLGGLYLYTPAVGVAQITFPTQRISQKEIAKAVKAASAEAKADLEAQRKRRSEDPFRDGASGGGGSSSSGDEEESASSGGGDEKSGGGAAEPADNEPIAIERVTYSVGEGGQVRGTVVLKNDATVAIRNMFVFVTMQAPDVASGSDLPRASGLGGSASVPAYVKSTTDNSLPTYGGTPPTSISSSYPEMATGGRSSTAPPLTSASSAASQASPEASPTPTPMHDVATLPAIFVDEIGPGKTVSVPFTWSNPQRLPQTSPTVRTQHDFVEFTRKKEKPEGEEATSEGGTKSEGGEAGENTEGGGSSDAAPAAEGETPKEAPKGEGGKNAPSPK